MAVRELITKIKFQIDRASQSQVNTAIQRLKSKLQGLSGKNNKIKVNADTSAAQSSLSRIKTQLNSLNGKTVTTYVNTVQRGSTNPSGNSRGGSQKKDKNSLQDNAGTLMATGAAMVAPVAFPIKTAMEFEATMSKVKAITGSTDEDMKKLTETAKRLGESTQFSASQAAEAMTYLGMAGWKTEQIIAGMPGLLDLAAASGEDLARVSDIVSDDLTAFKMSADQAAHFSDVLAVASSNANTNVSRMGETFKYVGAIAGSQSYSIEDMAIATGILASNGIKGEQAGTNLRAIITRLVKPTNESAEAMDMLRISVANADGTMKPFRQVLEDIRKGFSGLTDAQKGEYAAMLGGQEAMSGLLALVNASDEDLNKLTNAVDNADGAASRMAQTMMGNGKGALKEFESAVEGLSITLGETFLPSLTRIIKEFTKFVRTIAQFSKEHPYLVGGIAALVAGLGTLLTVLGGVGLILSGVTTAFEVLAPIVSAIGGAFAGISLGPLLAVLLAIASAIYFVYENWDMVVSFFEPAIESMREGLAQLGQAWENLQPFIEAIMPLLSFVAQLIGGVIVGALSLLVRMWANGFNTIASAINMVCSLLGTLGEIIKTIAGGLSGIIDQALEFLGLSGNISGVNMSAMNSLVPAPSFSYGGDNVQTNNYTFTSPTQLYPAQKSNNLFFQRND